MNVFAVIVLLKIHSTLKVLRSSSHINRKSSPGSKDHLGGDKTVRILRDYEVVYKDYKQQTFLQQAFLLFTVARLCIFYIILSYMFAHPVAQMTLILIINISMLVYLSFIRPHQVKIQLIECLTGELALLIVNICVLVLSIMDQVQAGAEVSRKNLGRVIIVMNLALIMAVCIVMFVKIGIHAVKVYKNLRQRYLRRKVRPVETQEKSLELRHMPLDKEDDKLVVMTPRIEASSGIESGNLQASQTFNVSPIENHILLPPSQSQKNVNEGFSEVDLMQVGMDSSERIQGVNINERIDLFQKTPDQVVRNRKSSFSTDAWQRKSLLARRSQMIYRKELVDEDVLNLK